MKRLLLCVSLLFFTVVAFSQKQRISGTVINPISQTPVAGATVATKQNKATTNDNGQFTIEAEVGDELTVSHIGMKPFTQRIQSLDPIRIQLDEEASELEQVIVTGYSAQRKVDLTGAVSVVKTADIANLPASNLVTSLQGRVPGVFIEADGRPNGGQRTLVIRGFNTLGNTSPLFVIDGVPTLNQEAFQNLDPNQIESMQVLKDATAASIYGSRASNGVIIVTTKQGKDRMQVTFTSSYGKAYFTDKLPVLDVYERGRALWQAAINDKLNPAQNSAVYSFESHVDANGVPVLDKVIPVPWVGGNPADLTPGANTDWQDVVFRNGTIKNHELSISYGTRNSGGVFGVGYLDNQGIMEYMQFRKYNARVNTFFNFLDGKIKIGENLQVSYTRNTPERTDLGGSNVVNLARYMQPLLPVYKTNGDWSGPIGAGYSDRNNPLHMLYIYRNNFDHTFNGFGNVYVEIKPIKNLLLKSSYGLDYINGYNKAIFPTFTTGFLSRQINSMTIDRPQALNWVWSNTANYTHVIGSHNISLLAGTEAIKNRSQTLGTYKEGFAIQDLDYWQLSAGTGNQTATGTSTGNQLLSYFGKINYNFADRYLLALTVRRDGSSRFGENNRYGTFPSISAGWRLNNESFLQNVSFLSNLKLRGGWGRVGNQEIGDESSFGVYATNYGLLTGGRRNVGTAYDITAANGGTLPSGYSQVRRGNPDLRWETTEEVNAGIDFGFFQESLIGNFDVFSRRTYDILITPPYAAVIGAGASQVLNGATVENKGYELTLGYRSQTKSGFAYSVGINIAGFRDKVVKIPSTVVSGYPGNVEKTILGHSPREIFGYIVEGIFQNTAEVTSSPAQPGKGVGRLKYADLNKDGKIDPLDQDWLGNQIPKAEYGINIQLAYKGIELSLFTQGVYKRTVNNTTIKSSSDFLQSGMNMGRRVLQAWTPQNPTSTIPALSNATSNQETRSSTYFMERGDYLKLRTAQLNYTIPKNLTEKIKAQSLRVFLIGENLFTYFNKNGKRAYTGPDPSLPGTIYPQTTNVTLGVNLSF
jgi:TonB-dependent starch-binding outer membrane protein SusC